MVEWSDGDGTAGEKNDTRRHLFSYLEENRRASPKKLYLVDKRGYSYRWQEASEKIEAIARSLGAIFPGDGNCISILAENSSEWILTDLGIIRSGNISAPLFTSMTQEKFLHAVESTNVKLIFVGSSEAWQKVRDAVPPNITIVAMPNVGDIPGVLSFDDFLARGTARALPDLEDTSKVCTLIFTSGTTGKPKAVMHSLDTLLEVGNTFIGMTQQLELAERRLMCYLPLSHIAERAATVVQSLLIGATIHLSHDQQHFVADLRDVKPTMLLGVPRIWQRLLQLVFQETGEPPESLKKRLESNSDDPLAKQITRFLGLEEASWLLSSSAITPRATKDWYKLFGLDITDLYGQTEILPLTTKQSLRAPTSSVGSAAPGFEIRIGDDGEILGRGPGAALGYYNDPIRTASTFVNGWVHTGDKGYLDEQGFLYIIGRVQDTFKTAKGKYVAPGPIEEQFSRIDIVEQQSLCGLGLTQPIMLCTLGAAADKLKQSEIEAILYNKTKELNENLEPHEKIEGIIVSRETWTIEDGLLTHTHKTIRDRVLIHHELAIQAVEHKISNGQRECINWM